MTPQWIATAQSSTRQTLKVTRELTPLSPVPLAAGQDLDINKSSMRMGLVEEDIYVSPGEATVAVSGVRRDGTEVSRAMPDSPARQIHTRPRHDANRTFIA